MGRVRAGVVAAGILALGPGSAPLDAGPTAPTIKGIETLAVPFVFEPQRGAIVLDLTVDGRQAFVILDTGAGRTVLSAAFLRVPSGAAQFSANRPGITGEGVWMRVALSLGGRSLGPQPVRVMDLSEVSRIYERKVDGLLGQDVLARFDAVEIDFQSRMLRLTRGRGLTSDSAGANDGGGASAPFRVRARRGALATSIEQALSGAATRLAAPDCGAIFSDFADSTGRPLQANLDALGETGQGYLRLVGFYDGTGQARCLTQTILAITSPGSRAVFVCPQFAIERQRDPGLAEAVLIHEALHSLGLGEDPPSAAAITSKVMQRCGR